jgi:serine protease Do
LGKSDWFYKVMTTSDPVDLIPKTNYQLLTLQTRSQEFHQPIRQQFSSARKAIITVHAEKDTAGSGFFINNEGYALTTAGVVGDAGQVQIMDVNGTKYAAKVLRKDDRRDVALIKADIKDNSSLPISSVKKVDLVDEIYAIGTPYSNSYRATITKGIISATRYHVHQGLSFIQASVPTTSGYSGGPLTDAYGNVIGLTRTIASDAGETNFSLFIPIQDALKALNIKLETEHF